MVSHTVTIISGLLLAEIFSSRSDTSSYLQVVVLADLLFAETKGKQNRRSADRLISFVSPYRAYISIHNFLLLSFELISSDDLKITGINILRSSPMLIEILVKVVLLLGLSIR